MSQPSQLLPLSADVIINVILPKLDLDDIINFVRVRRRVLIALKQEFEVKSVLVSLRNISNGVITSIPEAKMAIRFGLELNTVHLNDAIKNGNLELARYLTSPRCQGSLEEQKVRPDHGSLNSAIENGYLEFARYLIEEQKVEPNTVDLKPAVRDGNLEFAKYLIEEQEVEPDVVHLSTAIRNGDLEFAKYLIEEQGVHRIVTILSLLLRMAAWKSPST